MTNAFACVRMHVEVYRSARVVFYVRGLASYFRALLFFVSFLRLPHQEEFCVLGRRSPSSCAQKISWAHSLKSYFFSPVRSRGRRSRFPGASARFSAPLTRARSPVKARAWRGQGGGDVSRSRASLVFCLGSQILNFHSRAFSAYVFFK